MSALEPINFTRGVPANESFPEAELAEAARRVLEKQAVAVLQYGPAAGLAQFREWLAKWQGVAADRVLVGNGSLELVEFLCIGLLSRGDLVYTESPSYDRAIKLFRRNGMEVEGVPLEADGPDIDALEKMLARRVPKLFYVIPDFQNPAGATCSLEKRKRLVELAEKHDFLLLEDAPYRLLRYRGTDEPTLYSLAPGRVLHMSSFTKLIAPGVRAGFMIGDPAKLAKIGKVAEDTYISPGYFAHGVTAEWCAAGQLGPQIERLKKLYAPRLDATLAAIDKHMPDAVATRPNGGFFLSVTLPEGTSTTAVREAATKYNLNLADGLAFFPSGGGERFLRLPFCALTPEQIDEGIRRLALAVKDARGA
jgi:2-aminoadipate transaminase|nr:MAG: PLP-dependent aminotransferase family protein [Pseudomonadota bacterium]